jgi:hypothetical protein
MLVLLAAAAMGAPEITAAKGTVKIDGVLDEPEWATAPVVSDFLRFQPSDGGAPVGTTEVRILQDERAIYFGVHVSGADYPIRARITPREQFGADDQIGLYIDPFGDGQNGYIFYLNARGLQEDTRHDGGPDFESWNFSWDTVWWSEGKLRDDGYDLEIAIPFRSLKFPGGGGQQDWGLMVTRKIPSEGAKYGWPDLDRGHPRMWTQEARLHVETPKRGSGLEVVPGLTIVQQAARETPQDELIWTGWDEPLVAARPSVDLRYGLTPSIGLTATVHPDFSQVDFDETPIGLNNRFAFYFPERRPFFLDGKEYFADIPETLYSRSIVDPLYGVKSFGKEGAWSLGVVHALDRDPGASVNQDGAPGFSDADVADAYAANTVARVEHNVGDGGYVGITAADKELVGFGLPVGGGSHQLASVDAALPVGERWSLMPVIGASHTAGKGGADAISGLDYGMYVERASGVGTGVELGAYQTTEGFRRETGFLTQSGVTVGEAEVDYTLPIGESGTTFTPSVSIDHRDERDGGGGTGVWLNQETTIVGVHYVECGGGWSRTEDEGVAVDGPYFWAWYDAQAGRVLAWELGAEGGTVLDYDHYVPADTWSVSGTAILRPAAGLRLDLSYAHERLFPEDLGREIANRARGKATWQFTRELGVRALEEVTFGSERDPMLISSLLATWLYHPGTAVHVGYAETTDLAEGKAMNRTVFAKGTFLLRI